MAFMEWSSELSVGLDSVDDQHKWLLDATNRLHDALNQPQTDRAAVAEILEGLMDYTMNHFIMEEELFERFDYPQAARHKAMHDLFTRTVMLTITAFENGADVGPDVLDLLKQWLVHHIMGADKAYVPFLAAQGVAA